MKAAVARLISAGIVFGLFCAIIATVISEKPGPNPYQSPPGVNVHPGLNTADVPCDWCSKMTKNPTPQTKANPTATPAGTPTPTVTVTVIIPAPNPSPY